MHALATDVERASTKRFVAAAILCVLAACGGGGSDNQPPPPPPPPVAPATGTVTIPAGSEIVALGVGAADQIIYVLPGESTAHRVELLNDDATARYDVTVTEGSAIARAVEADGRWAVVVDAQSLAAGSAHTYRLQVRNRTTGVMAEIYGPIRVLAPTLVGSGQISAAGGTVVIAGGLGQVVFDPQAGAQTLGVTVLTAESPDGKLLRVRFDKDVAADERGVSIQLPADGTSTGAYGAKAALDTSQRKTRLDLSPEFVELSSRIGVFATHGGFRLDNTPTSLSIYSRRSCGPRAVQLQPSQVCVTLQAAVRLSVRRGQAGASSQAVEPVLFVHGYTFARRGPELGGGEGTWGAFPRLAAEHLYNTATGYPVQSYEFQWATNAKFEQVADELARAINRISEDAPGNKITIVAHSFGGVLVRTMLQGRGTNDFATVLQVAGKIRQVITLGTPHSGIADVANYVVNGVSLPKGQDSLLFEGCDQISCHQMGEPALNADEIRLIGVSPVVGLLAAQLSTDNLSRLESIPFAVGIGVGLKSEQTGVRVTTGDSLISFDGQRFRPELRFDQALNRLDPYLACDSATGPQVREVVLVDAARLPGRTSITTDKGLVHTAIQISRPPLTLSSDFNQSEVAVSATTHPSFAFVKQTISDGVCPPRISAEPQSVSVRTGESATFNVTASGEPVLRYQWFRDGVAIPNATSPAFTIAAVTTVDSGASISVVVSNLVGSRTSASALLTVMTAGPAPSQGQRIASGSNGHTCAVTLAGGVKCWGSNFAGQLGDGTRERRLTAVDVVGLRTGVTAISLATNFSCALTSAGGVKCWGYRTGDGTENGSTQPVDVLGLSSGVSAISAGESEICALTTAGGVKCWGHTLSPVDVAGLSSGVVAVAAGWKATCVITSTGGVKCWGGWPLGDGAGQGSDTPVDVVGLGAGVVAISSSAGGICAVTTAGAALCWATIFPGDGSNVLALLPVVPSGLDSGVAAISTAGDLTCVLMTSGGVKCWGTNDRGGVGVVVGPAGSRELTPVDVFGPGSGVISIGTRHDTACALMSTGGAKCWGMNGDGAVGDGTQIDRYTPVDVVGF